MGKRKKNNHVHKTIEGITHKQCNICNEFKPANKEYFYLNSKNITDGLYPYCKLCAVAKASKRQEENKDKKLEYAKRYNHKPGIKEINKEYKRKYREKGGQANWFKNNKDKAKLYRESHRDHDVTQYEWEECKKYFNNSCAYCELHISEHFVPYRGKLKWTDLHKEHVKHDGVNDLSNCIPACQSCNSQKWIFEYEEWYNNLNVKFSFERHGKIVQWLKIDYKQYIN